MSEQGAPSPLAKAWRSRAGFVLASIGAAVGIGNIWRFSYVAGEHGGGAFLIAYAGFVVPLGAPLILAELALGRQAKTDVVSAYRAHQPPRPWMAAGYLGALSAIVILSFYAVVAGWVLRYAIDALSGDLLAIEDTAFGGYFEGFITSSLQPMLWQATMLLATALVVLGQAFFSLGVGLGVFVTYCAFAQRPISACRARRR